MPDKDPRDRPDFSAMAKAWNIGAAILALTLGGHWLDVKCHTNVLFTITGVLLGVAYSVWEARDIINK